MSDGKKSRTPGQERLASRRRNWAFLLYQDSAPDNWMDRLAELHIPAFVSPLHDRDTKDDGTLKKPHYHVLLMFDAMKAEDQVKPIIEELGGANGQFERVQSVRAYARYLTHMDEPEKVHYSADDVMEFGGASYLSVVRTSSDDSKALGKVLDFVRVNQILSYADLLDVTRDGFPELFDAAQKKSYVLGKYIQALAWENEHGYVRRAEIVDPDTGEVRPRGMIEKGCGEDGG